MGNLQATMTTCATFLVYRSQLLSLFILEPKEFQASMTKLRKVSQLHFPTILLATILTIIIIHNKFI